MLPDFSKFNSITDLKLHILYMLSNLKPNRRILMPKSDWTGLKKLQRKMEKLEGLCLKPKKSLKKIPGEKMDEHVRNSTDFPN